MTALFFLVAWLRTRRLDGGALRQTATPTAPLASGSPVSATVSPTHAHRAERTQP